MTDMAFYILLSFNLLFLAIIIFNLIFAPRIRGNSEIKEGNLKVSVLIPARNEEENIGGCLNSLTTQTHKEISILVLDDNSSDNTSRIVQEYSGKDPRVRLLKGKPLPDGWLGKNWACSQLADSADNEILLFIDADVRLSSTAIENGLKIFREKKLQMLSVFPTQIIESLGTWLVTPMMNWLLLTFLPLRNVFTSRNQSFVAANGQFIMIDRKTYDEIGGHENYKSAVVEDMEMARTVKIRGYKLLTALGDKEVFCKMYDSFSASFKGFSKNFFRGFGISPFIFLLMIIFFQAVFLFPLLLGFQDFRFLIILLVVIVGRILIALTSRQSILINVLFHPAQMIIMFLIGINSVLLANTKGAEWKGRKV